MRIEVCDPVPNPLLYCRQVQRWNNPSETFCCPNEAHFAIFTFFSLLSSMASSTWRSSMRSAGPRDLYSPLWNRTCLDPPKPCLFVPLRKFLGSVGLRPRHFSYPPLGGVMESLTRALLQLPSSRRLLHTVRYLNALNRIFK